MTVTWNESYTKQMTNDITIKQAWGDDGQPLVEVDTGFGNPPQRGRGFKLSFSSLNVIVGPPMVTYDAEGNEIVEVSISEHSQHFTKPQLPMLDDKEVEAFLDRLMDVAKPGQLRDLADKLTDAAGLDITQELEQ